MCNQAEFRQNIYGCVHNRKCAAKPQVNFFHGEDLAESTIESTGLGVRTTLFVCLFLHVCPRAGDLLFVVVSGYVSVTCPARSIELCVCTTLYVGCVYISVIQHRSMVSALLCVHAFVCMSISS